MNDPSSCLVGGNIPPADFCLYPCPNSDFIEVVETPPLLNRQFNQPIAGAVDPTNYLSQNASTAASLLVTRPDTTPTAISPATGAPDIEHSEPLQYTSSNGLMLTPNQETGSGIHNRLVHVRNWAQTTVWPDQAEALLRTLISTHELFTSPHTPDENKKLCAIFDEFYDKTHFRGLKPPKSDEGLWQMFRGKVDQLQQEMLRQREATQLTRPAILLPMDTIVNRNGDAARTEKEPTQPILVARAQTLVGNKPAAATPPATPILSNDKNCDGAELWNALDAAGQAALFRLQLRSAKNRKSLMLEWNDYCAEVRQKRKEKSRDRVSATSVVRSTPSNTPPALATPTSSKPVDVNEIFANKLRELQLKKEREEQEKQKALQAEGELRQQAANVKRRETSREGQGNPQVSTESNRVVREQEDRDVRQREQEAASAKRAQEQRQKEEENHRMMREHMVTLPAQKEGHPIRWANEERERGEREAREKREKESKKKEKKELPGLLKLHIKRRREREREREAREERDREQAIVDLENIRLEVMAAQLQDEAKLKREREDQEARAQYAAKRMKTSQVTQRLIFTVARSHGKFASTYQKSDSRLIFTVFRQPERLVSRYRSIASAPETMKPC